MSAQLRIACIGTRGIPSNYSGIERACECLYTHLAARGHDITVYYRDGHLSEDAQRNGSIRLRHAPVLRTRALDTISHVAFSLADALTRGRYDLIHLHALAPGVFSRVCRAAGVPTVSTVHGLDWQRAKWNGLGGRVLRFGESSMVRNVDEIIVVSRDLQRYYADRYCRRTTHIPNGITPANQEHSENAVLTDFGLERSHYVLYLGRLVPEKRIEDLLAAYARIMGGDKLVITGAAGYTDPYVDGLRRMADRDSRVIFTGAQKEPAVSSLLRNASAYVLPSAMEGLPMALLECIEQGTPAVVSDIPPHRELLGGVRDFDLFFPPGDVTALRSCLEKPLRAPERYREIAAAVRRQVRQSHSWPLIAERTEAVFYNAVDRRRAGARGIARAALRTEWSK